MLAATAGIVQGAGLTEKTDLVGADFSQWRDGVGKWTVAAEVFLKSDNNKLLDSKPGSGAIVNGPDGRTSHLLSKTEFGDVCAHIEFMVGKGSNSGVYFQGRYEIQVFDSWGVAQPHHSDCGGIYQRWDDKRKPQGYEGKSPRVNASTEPGTWQTYDVIFRAPRFDANGKKLSNARFEQVIHNGTIIHEDMEVTGPTRSSAWNDEKPFGPLMLQGDHGPVAYRNIRLEPAPPLPFFAMDTATRDANHQSIEQQVAMLKELGYSGYGAGGCNGMEKIIEEIDKKGMRLFNTYAGLDIDQPEYDPNLDKVIDAFKGRNMILWLTVRSKKIPKSSEEGDEHAVELLRKIADKAAQNTVRIALYPHTGDWVESVEDVVRVVKKTDRPNVGATFNLCHWLKVGSKHDTKTLIEMAMPHLFVVTINGADDGGKDWKTLIQPLGSGTFDTSAFLKTLSDCGYNGPIGFQGYGIGGDVHDNLKRTMEAWLKMSGQMVR